GPGAVPRQRVAGRRRGGHPGGTGDRAALGRARRGGVLAAFGTAPDRRGTGCQPPGGGGQYRRYDAGGGAGDGSAGRASRDGGRVARGGPVRGASDGAQGWAGGPG